MATNIEHKVQRRNIVVLGKTGSGKSTVGNKIADQEVFKISDLPSSSTKKVTHTDIAIRKDDTLYTLKIIDTIGLFDTSPDKLSNDKVIEYVKQYFRDTVPEGVDLVLFILRNGRFTKEEKNTFDFIITHFKNELSQASALVITHCDGITAAKRLEIATEFKTNKETERIASFMGRGIYPVGFPDVKKLEPALQAVYEEMMQKDAEKLRDLAIGSDTTYLGKAMFAESFWDTCKLF